MNYIRQVNAFYTQLETNPLTATAANLWHVLMHVNNRAGWKEEITVAMSVLCSKANLTESTFKRARKELQKKGYICVKSRGGNQAAAYQIVSLDGMMSQGNDEMPELSGSMGGSVDDSVNHKMNRNMDHSMNHSLDHNVSGNADPLVKLNNTKQKDTTNTTDAIQFFQENFGLVSPYVAEDMIHWIDDLGEALVLYAMKRALERGSSNWGYVKAILDSWVKKGIRNVDDARAEEVEYRRRREQKSTRKSGGYRTGGKVSAEIVPDWFREGKHKVKPKREQNEDKNVNVEKEVAEVARRLREYANA
ncbi:DnaD domain protein [Oceanobacillus rekensis]|uniref:DnaD domain protein n=1 Tax=Oceanobacillus rekensis TaxID=937927 RepID=UPI000B44F92B|nr:DnaD domain protein [Oceanobacillus rekensis]